MSSLRLPSGLEVMNPAEMLLAFCREEYAYYDGILSGNPWRIEPVDVLATVSMNSNLQGATEVRKVHRGLAAACEPLLGEIPADADLVAPDAPLDRVEGLLHVACLVPGVLVPRAAKVLHRKRRRLIPMLDTVVIGYFLDAFGRRDLRGATQDKHRAAGVAGVVLRWFRDDLEVVAEQVEALAATLGREGFPLTSVRILEALVWMSVEPIGYYRQAGGANAG